MKRIILASGSPRRRQLMEQAEFVFEVITADVNEDFPSSIPSAEVPEFLARRKAAAVLATLSDQEDVVVVAADTVVILCGRIIGKPRDGAEAIAILQQLSGKEHQVITGVALQSNKELLSFSAVTTVYFKELSAEEIQHYVRRYSPLDKAGSYAIQEWIGLIGIDRIEGDFYNVMGLPVSKLVAPLRTMVS